MSPVGPDTGREDPEPERGTRLDDILDALDGACQWDLADEVRHMDAWRAWADREMARLAADRDRLRAGRDECDAERARQKGKRNGHG